MNRIKQWFSYSNLVATFAVFLAMGGAAYAVSKAPRNSVTSPSIRNGSVMGKDVKNDSLTGADVNEATLDVSGTRGAPGPAGPAGPQGPAGLSSGPAGGDLTGNYPNPQIAPGKVGTEAVADDSLTGADINEATLTGLKAQRGGLGRYGYIGECDPTGTAFNPCTEVTIPPTGPARLLVIGTVEAVVDPGKEVGLGSCRLWASDGTIDASTTSVSARQGLFETPSNATLTAVTSVLTAGEKRVGLECNQRFAGAEGGIRFPRTRMSVVVLSDE